MSVHRDHDLPLGGLGMSQRAKTRFRLQRAADAAARRKPRARRRLDHDLEPGLAGKATRSAQRCPVCGGKWLRTHCPRPECARVNGGQAPPTNRRGPAV